MAKSLFEELGGKYERQGDYLIPCLTVPAEEEQAMKKITRFTYFFYRQSRHHLSVQCNLNT